MPKLLPALRWPSDTHLRRLSWVLVILIIACNLYVIATPFLPQATFKITQLINRSEVSYRKPDTLADINRDRNQLVIPSIKLASPIFEGPDSRTVDRGIWRQPSSATPNQPGNTVLAGHRFSYRSPSVFYHLNSIHKGDEMLVVWQKKIYAYRVTDIKTVKPDDLSVGASTSSARLTLYTCTPVWSTKNRLVIIGSLEKIL